MSRNIYWMLLQSVWLFLAGGMRGPTALHTFAADSERRRPDPSTNLHHRCAFWFYDAPISFRI